MCDVVLWLSLLGELWFVLFIGCYVVCVLLLRDCCVFVFICGLSLLAIVARCFLRAVAAYPCCLPFVVVCCPLFGACCVFVAACVL